MADHPTCGNPRRRRMVPILSIACAGLFIAAWYTYPLFIFNALSSQAFLGAALFVAGIAWRYELRATPAEMALIGAFVSAAVLASSLSMETWPALAKDTHWFWLLIAAPLLGRVFYDSREAVQTLRIAAAATILYTLGQMAIEAENYLFWLRNPVFGHIRHFGLSIGLCTVLLYCTTDDSPYAAAFFRGTRIVGLALVFWSGTRAAILAWLLCLLALSLGDRRLLKTALADSSIAAGLSLIPSAPLPSIGLRSAFWNTFGAQSADGLSSGRISLWLSTLHYLIDSGFIWTGAGGNGFVRVQWLQNANIMPFGHLHPHNIIIQALCDWGIAGAVLLLLLAVRLLPPSAVFPALRQTPRAALGVLFLIVTGMFDATLYLFEFFIYLAFSLGIFLAAQDSGCSSIRPGTIAIPRIIIIATIALLLLPHLLSLDYRIGFRWYFRTYDFLW